MWLTACSSDSGDDAPTNSGNALQMGGCATRSGNVSLSDATQIAFFLTNGTTAKRCTFTYYAEAARWSSNATTEEGTPYHLYGTMSAHGATTMEATPLAGDFANGAVLTLNGLNPVTTQSIDFIVGVKGGDGVAQASDITEWSYLYEGQPEGQNSVHLLLDHLYAAVSMQLKVTENYAKLRTIKLKDMRLQPTPLNTVDVSVTQPVGGTPIFSQTTSAEATSAPVLLSNADGVELSTETPVQVEAYLIPGLEGLKLISTYDVYDKSGKCLRKDCTSENNLLSRVRMERGTRTILNLTVNPTYLGVLSDPDFNNPKISIE